MTDRRVIEAETFLLRDRDGRVRGALGCDTRGNPGLTLYGADGRPRMTAEVHGNDPRFTLHDETGETRVRLHLIDQNAAEIQLGASDEIRLLLSDEEGIAITDPGGTVRVSLGVGPDGSPVLNLIDSAGQVRIGLVAGEEDSFILFTDEDGKPLATLPRPPRGAGDR